MRIKEKIIELTKVFLTSSAIAWFIASINDNDKAGLWAGSFIFSSYFILPMMGEYIIKEEAKKFSDKMGVIIAFVFAIHLFVGIVVYGALSFINHCDKESYWYSEKQCKEKKFDESMKGIYDRDDYYDEDRYAF